MVKFVHLRAHTEYSIFDGLLRISDWVSQTVKLNMPAMAITDRCNIFGLVKFYRTALANGIKPIIGSDLTLYHDGEYSLFTVLCKNQQGYKHLRELITHAYLHGQQGHETPIVTWDGLCEMREGLIVLSGGFRGDVGQVLVSGQEAQAEEKLLRWKKQFANDYYLELTRTGRENEEIYLHAAITLAAQHAVPVVATNDVRFLTREDFEAHEARVCIHSGYVLEDAKRPRIYSEQQYLRSSEEMAELFSDIPEALQNTVEIAKRCNVTLTLGNSCLPAFPVPADITLEAYIAREAQNGLQHRLKLSPSLTSIQLKIYEDRLALELDVINRMGFPGYFLIVADFIRWAKQNHIPVGPGRGSGAGSLVAYALGITELDPITHDLLFERFLNPERVSMPDFDIDFCMEGRDRVIEYVAQRYGRDAVSQIITFGTMAAKAVVRDVGRVLGLPYGFVDKVAKLIPFELGMTLEKALEQEEQLAKRYAHEEEVTTLIDLARKLEGITRNAGKHAGGVVIASTKLTDFAPLYCEPDGQSPVTQFDKDDAEAVGLVKFDFLGLRTLTIIDWALKAVNQKRASRGESQIDITQISLEDEKTFLLLQECKTTAVFQLESRGMKDLIRRLKPDCFDDITALVALFRPGPLQSGMVDDFMDRKHGRAPVYYPHPDLEPILAPTYGVILYQEQVMQIAQVLAGYSLGGADILRRAMGKKKPEEMAKQRAVFISGASNNHIDSALANSIFDLMEKFAGYGFNKSHSAAYALIAYQTAWLKAHYPAEYMAAVLSSDMDNTDKVVSFFEECRQMQLQVNPPDITCGRYAFTVNDRNEIEYGLGAIKGAGQAAIEHIVFERDQNGPFANLFDFVQRVDTRKVNRRAIEPLIYSGALDCFQQPRSVLYASVDEALRSAEQKNRNQTLGQSDLFGLDAADTAAEVRYQTASPWTDKIRLQKEKESLGMYVSGHPLDACENEFNKIITAPIAQLKMKKRKVATVGGMIVGVRTMMTRTGKRMAVITLEDRTGRMDATIFSDLFDEVRVDLVKDQIVIIKGQLSDDEYTGGVKCVAQSLELFDGLRSQLAKHVFITLNSQHQVHVLLEKLQHTLTPYRGGSCPISIEYATSEARARLQLGSDWQVNPADECIEQLKLLCGAECVQIQY